MLNARRNVSALLCLLTVAAGLPPHPAPTAVFGFSFDDTSLQGQIQGPRADEHARLTNLNAQLRNALIGSGCCRIVDLGPVARQAESSNLQDCGACDVDLARNLGASISVTGWVQKVSNLILNINVVARDVTTGRIIAAGSVDIRGNTEESWTRGLTYLLRDRLHPAEW